MTQQSEHILYKEGIIRAAKKTVPAGTKNFPFSSAPRTCLGLKQPPPPIQWAPGSLFLGIKRPRRGFDLSLLSNAGLGICICIYSSFLKSLQGIYLPDIELVMYRNNNGKLLITIIMKRYSFITRNTVTYISKISGFMS